MFSLHYTIFNFFMQVSYNNFYASDRCTSNFFKSINTASTFFLLLTLNSNFNLPFSLLITLSLYTNLSIILLLSLLSLCLVVDVAALRFVAPSTLVYSLTSNTEFFTLFYFLLFSVFCLQQFPCIHPPPDIIPSISVEIWEPFY